MDFHVITFYQIYRTKVVVVLRCVIVLVLSAVIPLQIVAGNVPTLFIFLLNLQVMLEIFYRYDVGRHQSVRVISQVSDNEALSVMTLPALTAAYHSTSAREIIKHLLSYPQTLFFLERAAIAPEELPKSSMGNAILVQMAFKLAKTLGGRRVTTMDLMASYLLLEEKNSKLLFQKKLKEDDVMALLRWSRLIYPYEEETKKLSIKVHGGGIGQFLITGWTPETKLYTRDLSFSVQDTVSIVGREAEYKNMIDTLCKTENNNVILVGEAGVGKEQLVQRLAYDCYSAGIDRSLQYKIIIELLVGNLLAGATTQGDLESRLQSIIGEVSHAGNVILYIPELQDLLGAGSFSLDLSGALAPYLKNGTLPIIGSSTAGNFKTFFLKSPLSQLFSPIMLTEPLIDQSEKMVMEKMLEVEEKNSVVVTYLALKAAVKYADRYSQSTVLPGSAITFLLDAVSGLAHQEVVFYGKTKKRLLTEGVLIKNFEQKTRIVIGEPTQTEKDQLLHLEETLHKKVIGQDEAITMISQAMRRIRSGIEDLNRPVSFLFLGPTGVGKTETAKSLAGAYFGSEESMIRLDMSEYADIGGQIRLLGSLPGQGEERGELTEKVRDNPFCLVLLDELEKAHPAILNLFLQILDDGRITDNKGKTVSFINVIIIATSNAGSDFIRQAMESGRTIDKVFGGELLQYLEKNHIYRPELLNRFDAIVTFKPLTQQEISQVTNLFLQDFQQRLADKDITLSFASDVINKISQNAYSKEFGARPIKRYLQDTIEEMISQKLLKNELSRGDSARIMLMASGELSIEKAV